jgi:hypothetical protein
MTTFSPPTIGSPFGGGYYGGAIRIRQQLYSVIWAPKPEGECTTAWSSTRASVPGATSCFDSMANTAALAEAGNKLALWAKALRIGGFDDWCLPARDVLELAYRHLKPMTHGTVCSFRDGDNPSSFPAGYPYAEGEIQQTAIADFQAGGPQAFVPGWHWTSTQYSESFAWSQYFNDGNQNYHDKKYEARARAVRLIQLDA